LFIPSFIENSEVMEKFSIQVSEKSIVNKFNPESDYILKSQVLVPYSNKLNSEFMFCVPDDNRSVIIPHSPVLIEDEEFNLSIKGVGARAPLYGFSPLDFTQPSDFQSNNDPKDDLTYSRIISHENWFGESPYGAQGYENALSDLEISELYFKNELHHVNICPVIEINELPQDYVMKTGKTFWYRKYVGRFFQEKRLIPSNIRLFHQSNLTLGQSLDIVLKKFNIDSIVKINNFMTNYISSGLAIITILARTLRFNKETHIFEALDFSDVWLDKDSLISPSGKLYFADLEGLDWINISDPFYFENKVKKQVNRNYYEFMYCLDLLIKERDRMNGRITNQKQKRELLFNMLDLALIDDQFLEIENTNNHLDLIINPNMEFNQVSMRFIDLE
jgi:uncharacterized protein YoaH (UPF0181 family)